MFCPNCGSIVQENSKFCAVCGSPVNKMTPNHNAGREYNRSPAVQRMSQTYPQPGYSDRVYDPEILAAVKKNRKASGIFGLIIVPIPFIGFVIYSLATGNMELSQAMLIGGIVSGVFLLFALIGMARGRAAHSYEGVVVDKRSSWENRGNSRDNRHQIQVFTTVVRAADGSTKKIREHEGSMVWAWDYLQIGDHFKYHPQFNFPYELYDKSKAPYIACVGCTTKNPVAADRCRKCNLPLLK